MSPSTHVGPFLSSLLRFIPPVAAAAGMNRPHATQRRPAHTLVVCCAGASAMTDDCDGATGAVQQLAGHRAEHAPGQAVPVVPPHDRGLGAVRGVDQLVDGVGAPADVPNHLNLRVLGRPHGQGIGQYAPGRPLAGPADVHGVQRCPRSAASSNANATAASQPTRPSTPTSTGVDRHGSGDGRTGGRRPPAGSREPPPLPPPGRSPPRGDRRAPGTREPPGSRVRPVGGAPRPDLPGSPRSTPRGRGARRVPGPRPPTPFREPASASARTLATEALARTHGSQPGSNAWITTRQVTRASASSAARSSAVRLSAEPSTPTTTGGMGSIGMTHLLDARVNGRSFQAVRARGFVPGTGRPLVLRVRTLDHQRR